MNSVSTVPGLPSVHRDVHALGDDPAEMLEYLTRILRWQPPLIYRVPALCANSVCEKCTVYIVAL